MLFELSRTRPTRLRFRNHFISIVRGHTTSTSHRRPTLSCGKNTMAAISIGKGYLVRRLQVAPTVPCPCGQSTRPLTRTETPACNLHVTFIQDSVKHFHKECTEVYYILEGEGKMELNDDLIDIHPQTIVYIEPYTPHRLYSKTGVRTIVFGVPALKPDDEYFVT